MCEYGSNERKPQVDYVAVASERKQVGDKVKLFNLCRRCKRNKLASKVEFYKTFGKVVVLLLNMFNFITLMINAGKVNIDQTYF